MVIKELEKIDGIKSAGPNYRGQPEATPNDPLYGSQWGLSKINAPGAWNITTSSRSVKVGILDTGIANYSDLNANVVSGWDFINGNSITTDDTDGHGTHIAGIVGAVGNNNTGISGFAGMSALFLCSYLITWII